MTDPQTNCIRFNANAPAPEEMLRLDKEGFHYRGQFIADAGEAHRLMVEFLKQQTQPEPVAPTDEELEGMWIEQYGYTDYSPAMSIFWFKDAARAVLARWGTPAIAAELKAP